MPRQLKKSKVVVGILGHGEIGKSIARICQEAGMRVLVREIVGYL